MTVSEPVSNVHVGAPPRLSSPLRGADFDDGMMGVRCWLGRPT